VLPEPSSIRSLFVAGPAGRLEALLNAGSPSATHTAVVCHPHPLYGGTLHNKVVFHAMKALNSFGFPVLRFNFRGTGLSEGEHANGTGEVEDVRAALDWLEHEFTLPVVFAGFSFALPLDRAPPIRTTASARSSPSACPPSHRRPGLRFRISARLHKPKLFVSGSRDQFGPAGKLEALVNTFADPKNLSASKPEIILRRQTQGNANGDRRVAPRDRARRNHPRLTTTDYWQTTTAND